MCNMPAACRANRCWRSSATAPANPGANRDYVINTAAHLRALGLGDRLLDWLAEELQKPQA